MKPDSKGIHHASMQLFWKLFGENQNGLMRPESFVEYLDTLMGAFFNEYYSLMDGVTSLAGSN